MDFQALATVWSKESGVPREHAEAYLHGLIKVVGDAMSRGEEVRLPKLGKFVPKLMTERKAINNVTKKESIAPTCILVKFKHFSSSRLALWDNSPLNSRHNKSVETLLPFHDA